VRSAAVVAQKHVTKIKKRVKKLEAAEAARRGGGGGKAGAATPASAAAPTPVAGGAAAAAGAAGATSGPADDRGDAPTVVAAAARLDQPSIITALLAKRGLLRLPDEYDIVTYLLDLSAVALSAVRRALDMTDEVVRTAAVCGAAACVVLGAVAAAAAV
jgi:hypothetical protein